MDAPGRVRAAARATLLHLVILLALVCGPAAAAAQDGWRMFKPSEDMPIMGFATGPDNVTTVGLGGGAHAYASRHQPGALGFEPPVRVGSDLTIGGPVVADAHGGVSQLVYNYLTYRVMETRRNGDGTWTVPEDLVGEHVPQHYGRYAIAANEEGKVVLAWRSESGIVRARLRSPDGTWSPVKEIGTYVVDLQGLTAVVTPAGTVSVAWQRRPPGADGDTWQVQHTTTSLTARDTFGSPQTLSSNGTQPRLATDPDSRVVISYLGREYGYCYPTGDDISGASGWWNPVSLREKKVHEAQLGAPQVAHTKFQIPGHETHARSRCGAISDHAVYVGPDGEPGIVFRRDIYQWTPELWKSVREDGEWPEEGDLMYSGIAVSQLRVATDPDGVPLVAWIDNESKPYVTYGPTMRGALSSPKFVGTSPSVVIGFDRDGNPMAGYGQQLGVLVRNLEAGSEIIAPGGRAREELTFEARAMSAWYELVGAEWTFEREGTLVGTGSGLTVRRTFDEPGEYTATAEVEEGSGDKRTLTKSFTVDKEADHCVFPPANGDPVDDGVPANGVVTGPDEPTNSPGPSSSGTKAILRFGVAEAIGCFSQTSPGKWTNDTPGIRVNGIDVAAPSKSLEIDTNAWTIDSGDTVVRFSVSGQKVWAGTLDKQFSRTEMSEAFEKSVEATAFKSLKLTGSLVLGMEPPDSNHYSGATKLTLTGELPQTATVKFGSVGDGKLEFVSRTRNDSGLDKGTVTGTLGEVEIGKFGAKNLSFSYDFNKDAWTAGLDVLLPFPRVPQVGGSVTVTKGMVTGFTARTDGLQAPVGTGIFLQRLNIAASTGDDGATFTVAGGAGLSVGPKVTIPGGDEVEAVSGDGSVSYAFSNPGVWKLNAALSMVNVRLAEGELTVSTNGKVDFGGYAHLHGEVGPLDLFNAEGKLFGFADRDVSWQAQGALHDVKFLNWDFDDADAQALASSKGVAVCAGQDGHRVGFTYDYERYSAIGENCDVGAMAVVRGKPAGRSMAPAATTGDQVKVTVPEGETLAVFAGKAAGEAPRLSVAGPGGTSIVTPEDGAVQTERHMVGRDGEGRTYVVVFDPPAGTYDISSDRPLEEVAAADSTAGGSEPLTPVVGDPGTKPTPTPTPDPASTPTPDPASTPTPAAQQSPGAFAEPSAGHQSPGAFAKPPTAQPPQPALSVSGLSLKPLRLKKALARGLTFTGSASEPVALTASVAVKARTARKLGLGRKRVVLGRVSQRVGAGRFTLRVKVKRKLARKLKRARSVPIELIGTATSARSSARLSKKLILRR